MNTIDSLRRVLQYATDYLDIIPDSAKADPDIAAISQMIAVYDALAPKPDAWWGDAQWFVIDPNGDCLWFHDEPKANEWRWTNDDWFRDVGYEKGRRVNIPLGVDWRLCKWQRPEVAA